MAQPKKSDRRFTAALAQLEECIPVGKIPLPPKDKRAKTSSANHRAGRGGRGAKGSKAQIKRFRGKNHKMVSCYIGRR